MVISEIKTTMDKISAMQRKLNRRMIKSKDKNGSCDSSQGAQGEDPKVAQWVALQARSRKMSENEFRELAVTRQGEVDSVFERLLAFSLPSVTADAGAEQRAGEQDKESEMEKLVTAVNEVAEWFPGGSKEVKRRFSKYASVERKVEAMALLQVVRDDMRLLLAVGVGSEGEEGGRKGYVAAAAAARSSGSDIWEEVKGVEGEVGKVGRAKELLETKMRKWGDLREALPNFGQLGLSIDIDLVGKALVALEGECVAACRSLVAATRGIVDESEVSAGASGERAAVRANANGEQGKAIEEAREDRAQERMHNARTECFEALKLLYSCREFVSSFKMPGSAGANKGIAANAAAQVLDVAHGLASADIALLLKIYGSPALRPSGKAAVTKMFDVSLKTLKWLDKVRVLCAKAMGTRASVPASLSALLVSATHALLGHIVAAFESCHKGSKDSEGELIGWLVFGCGFINVVMGLVGDVKDARMEELISTFMSLQDKLGI